MDRRNFLRLSAFGLIGLGISPTADAVEALRGKKGKRLKRMAAIQLSYSATPIMTQPLIHIIIRAILTRIPNGKPTTAKSLQEMQKCGLTDVRAL